MIFVQYVALIVGTASLARGYYAAEHIPSVYWILGLGLLWILAEIRRWRWFTPIGFLACLGIAGYGLWIELPPGWMLAGALAALVVWDLSDFQRRLLEAAPQEEAPGLVRRHLLRLALVTAAGLAFSLGGMFYRWRLSFEWAAFLALLAALGLSLLIGRMHRP